VERVLRGIGSRRILALAEVLAERETMTGAELAAEARRLGAVPTRRAGRRAQIRRMLRR
jgi:hypothetical protein